MALEEGCSSGLSGVGLLLLGWLTRVTTTLALEFESGVLPLCVEPAIVLSSRAGLVAGGASRSGLCSKASRIHSGILGSGRRMPSTSTCHLAKHDASEVAAEAVVSLL